MAFAVKFGVVALVKVIRRVQMFSRKSICYALMLGFVFSTGLFNEVSAQDEKKQDKEIAWFDLDHCEICQNMASMKDDMHKIKWDVHMLDNGMLMVSVVPRKMKEAMAKADEGVQATVKKLEAGEQLDMCGFCQTYGELMGMGANIKDLKTVGVNITVITSSDPEVVKKIQAFGKQSKVEHKKMLAQAKTNTSSKKDE